MLTDSHGLGAGEEAIVTAPLWLRAAWRFLIFATITPEAQRMNKGTALVPSPSLGQQAGGTEPSSILCPLQALPWG